MKLVVSDNIRAKLSAKHGLCVKDVEEAFMNRTGPFLEDTSEEHGTDPPTYFFISENNAGTRIKVCFVWKGKNQTFILKTAFKPKPAQEAAYKAMCDSE